MRKRRGIGRDSVDRAVIVLECNRRGAIRAALETIEDRIDERARQSARHACAAQYVDYSR